MARRMFIFLLSIVYLGCALQYTEARKWGRQTPVPFQPIEFCNLPPSVGMCRAMIPRFAFNPQTGQCELFYYGGCGGNGNNFESREECMEMCGR
ncbi:Kunitz-type serine protease inhibitor 4 [Clonorchis sinensis]|uniref:Kunitz-type serine protease inhibitor 4 n=1 Tax=Clonorchis sinensis TaxID=79923 RepID=A0A419PZ56_CLOSI|nr:Kunitz-type serine protease inhibitor 4 [Clonorchis sinensis]